MVQTMPTMIVGPGRQFINLSMYTSYQNGFTRIAENNAKAVMQAIAILISEEYRPRFRPNDTMLDLYFIETHNQGMNIPSKENASMEMPCWPSGLGMNMKAADTTPPNVQNTKDSTTSKSNKFQGA
jgi:hypothetical protein